MAEAATNGQSRKKENVRQYRAKGPRWRVRRRRRHGGSTGVPLRSPASAFRGNAARVCAQANMLYALSHSHEEARRGGNTRHVRHCHRFAPERALVCRRKR